MSQLYSNIGKNEYTRGTQAPSGDIAMDVPQSGHRKSKFGLRHALKLDELYYMTKFEF